ncbi:MAG: putative bifunctional diguanylate cyclase/phosphodiesterase [Spirochaetaceae bacterium]
MGDTFERIINLSRDCILLVRPDYTVEVANDRVGMLTGTDRLELIDRPVAEVLGRNVLGSDFQSNLDRCFSGEELRYARTSRDGNDEALVDIHMTPFQNADGTVTHALVFARDIAGSQEHHRRHADAEYRDPLTGLLTRRSLHMILEKELENARRSGGNNVLALLFIALKNFKRINQTHGTGIGDLLLENTGIRIAQQVRKSDYVFRFEGTNLVVFLPTVSRSTDPAVVAQKLADAIGVPYRYRGMDLRISAIIGVSVFPDDASDADTMLQHANSAVIEAEAADRGFQLYDTSLHERAIARMTLHTELLRAFESRQLELYYQPIVNADGVIQGAEALIRWHHPTRGLVTPPHFMRLAEETGIVRAIDKWALYSVCERISEWSRVYGIFVSMNISARELEDEDLTDVLSAAMTGAGNVPAGRLKLELTESGCMRDPRKSITRIRRLKELGVDVWIDDFGTGQSSLSYLKRLPVPVLKIDKIFVDDLAHSADDRDYLASILAGVRSRGKQIIIEGVTTAAQKEILVEMGVRWMQGYHFARPLPADEFTTLLAAGRSIP